MKVQRCLLKIKKGQDNTVLENVFSFITSIREEILIYVLNLAHKESQAVKAILADTNARKTCLGKTFSLLLHIRGFKYFKRTSNCCVCDQNHYYQNRCMILPS